MTLTLKRILIFFSVALNIGFLVMALTQAWDRAIPKKERRWNDLVRIVDSLDLPQAKADQTKALMARFRDNLDAMDQASRGARMETLEFLSRPGALDQARLHALLLASDRQSEKKRELYEAHVLALRQVLGDKDSPRFFSGLKAHIESRHRSSGK